MDWILDFYFIGSSKDSKKLAWHYFSVCLASGILAFGVKLLLALYFEHIHNPGLNFNPVIILEGLKRVLKMMNSIHFYKTNWVLTIAELLTLATLLLFTLKKNHFKKCCIVVLILLPTFIALPLSLMTYSAQRAFYGPNIIRAIILSIFLYELIRSNLARDLALKIGLVFALIYSVQWAQISAVKRSNWHALLATESLFKAVLANCASPCKILVPPPIQGLKKDWVLPPMFWHSFYEWVQLKSNPEKVVEI